MSREHCRIESLESRMLLSAPPQWLHLGPTSELYLDDSAAAANGDLLLAGHTAMSVDLDPRSGSTRPYTASGNWSCFIVRYTPEGQPLWVNTIDRPDLTDGFQNHVIASDAAGNVVVAGTLAGSMDFDQNAAADHRVTSTPSTTGNDADGADLFVWKINPDGTYAWVTLISNTVNGTEAPSAVTVDRFGSIYVAGLAGGQATLTKIAANGRHVWTAPLCHAAAVIAIDHVDNPWVATSGQTLDLIEFTGRGKVVQRIGAAAPTDPVNHPGQITPKGLAFDRYGNIVLAGSVVGLYDLAPGKSQEKVLVPKHYTPFANIFCSKITPQGQLQFAFMLGSLGQDHVEGVGVDKKTGDIFLSGEFSGSVDFDPSPTGSRVLDSGDYRNIGDAKSDLYAARYTGKGHFVYATSVHTSLRDIPKGFGFVSPRRIFVAGAVYDSNNDVRDIEFFQQEVWS